MFHKIKTKYTSKFDRQIFGDRIRESREKKGYTQEQVADAVDSGKGPSFISNIEAWKPDSKDQGSGTTIKAAVAIANALDVSLDYLCNRDDFINKPITMGDIAHALMILSFVKGVHIREEVREFDSTPLLKNDGNSTEPIRRKEKRKVQVIEIQEGVLRHFLHQYQDIFERPHASDFFPKLNRELLTLDEIMARDEVDISMWEERVNRFSNGNWKIPKEEVERTVWKNTPPPTRYD